MSTKATPCTRRIRKTPCGTVIADRAVLADTFMRRSVGLIGRSSLEDGEALIIPSCRMVHMFFMRFALDLVFCAEGGRVLALQENLRPWRLSRYVIGARTVLELPEGTIASAKISCADTFQWSLEKEIE